MDKMDKMDKMTRMGGIGWGGDSLKVKNNRIGRFSHTLAHSQGERGIGELISPASPIERRPGMLDKKYAWAG